MSITVTPFLMFQGAGAEALDFYLATLPGAQVDAVERWGPGEAAPEGQIKRARFMVGGQSVLCMDSPPVHAFSFTPSFSFWIDCGSVDEVERLSAALMADGGGALMPAGDYGFSQRFAWVNDRFGVSWQLNCA